MNGMDGQNKPTEENNMRQNRILNYIGAASLLLAVCACGKENLNTTTDGDNGGAATALPEGTFVVDYSVSDGETSRAGEEGIPNTSISSLLYLLYDSEGKLVKEREIPDIDHETTWPLTRDKMTWEQRESLKDTLNVEMTYTAVFLANTDAELFKDASDKAEQVFFIKQLRMEQMEPLKQRMPICRMCISNCQVFRLMTKICFISASILYRQKC